MRRCCGGGMPSFSSTRSLIREIGSSPSMSISISLPVSVLTLICMAAGEQLLQRSRGGRFRPGRQDEQWRTRLFRRRGSLRRRRSTGSTSARRTSTGARSTASTSARTARARARPRSARATSGTRSTGRSGTTRRSARTCPTPTPLPQPPVPRRSGPCLPCRRPVGWCCARPTTSSAPTSSACGYLKNRASTTASCRRSRGASYSSSSARSGTPANSRAGTTRLAESRRRSWPRRSVRAISGLLLTS
mmetsp:Transcript_2675/g.6820  ORF Transcript_2675/g.6820 Transcript_2675/m.6820 type:complete len:247 (-) Transcript_2675:314-1054(-)